MINDYFDKIYCINLDRRRDKWLDVQKEFIKHSLVVDRFSAVDMQSAGPYFSVPEGADRAPHEDCSHSRRVRTGSLVRRYTERARMSLRCLAAIKRGCRSRNVA